MPYKRNPVFVHLLCEKENRDMKVRMCATRTTELTIRLDDHGLYHARLVSLNGVITASSALLRLPEGRNVGG
jgi:hypothetical protein